MNNKQTEQNLKKNRPNKILPIINTCFGGLFLAGSIFCKIKYNDIIEFTKFTFDMLKYHLIKLEGNYEPRYDNYINEIIIKNSRFICYLYKIKDIFDERRRITRLTLFY